MNPWKEYFADLDRFEGSYCRTLAAEPQHRWLALYRVASASTGIRRSLWSQFAKWYGRRYGLAVALGVLGPGLRLPHGGPIFINDGVRIGSNCQICHGVTITGDRRGSPALSDDVFVGPNVTIIGRVDIGRGAILAAGANIRSDVRAGALVLPADDAARRTLST